MLLPSLMSLLTQGISKAVLISPQGQTGKWAVSDKLEI